MPVAVICWTQEGCPACEDYLPKFLKVAERYSRCLPIIVADVNQYGHAANEFRVESTPTTVISRYGRRSFRFIDGDAPEHVIENLFYSATMGMDCQVGA